MLGNKILETTKSSFNKDIKVVSTFGVGTYIQAGGITQSGGVVKTIWKTALKNIGKEKVKSCLILGLGGGTVAGLVRKKYPLAKITGVEIDPVMVALGKKYLGLERHGVDIKIADARKFKLKKYDLVIVDTYLGDEYVNLLGSDLSKSGVIVFNRLFYGDKKKAALEFEKKLKEIFSSVEVVKPPANIIFICRK
ncbi:methyltransferase domain-containing protein [Candidatus Microgenomates bacterium]|nr:methyltransferase domain-containing protein [Candidatus Microgenomates bacterium]